MRKQILQQINTLLTECESCTIRKDYTANDSRLSTYCNKHCDVGKSLQDCGRELESA